MARAPINLGLQTNPARNAQEGDSALINCYAEPLGEEGKGIAFYPCEGLKLFANNTLTGAGRGMIADDSFIWYVAGSKLYRANAIGTVTEVASVPASGNVSFARNRVGQICLVVGGKVYSVGVGGIESQPQWSQFDPLNVTFIDGYFVFAASNGKFYWTEPDSFEYIATNFATAEANPDGLSLALKYRRELWLFGTDTIEAWKSTGSADQAFRRTGGGVIENGLAAPRAALAVKGRIYWIDEDYTLQVSGGDYNSQPVSVLGISRDIISQMDKNAIRLWSYTISGHRFVVLTCPDWTWVHNASTGKWHTRKSKDRDNWRIYEAVTFRNKLIGLDAEDGNLYEISRSYHDEAGDPLVMVIRTPIQNQFGGRASYDSLHLDMLTGQSEDSTRVSDPIVGMRFSDDGGGSWSPTFERTYSLGHQGKVNVQWHGLGSSQEQGRMFEFDIPTSIPRSVRAAYANVRRLGGT